MQNQRVAAAPLAISLGVIVLVAVVAIAGRPAGPHADGDGVLAGYDGPIREVMSIDAAGNGGATRYSYGTRLCQARPGSPPVLRSVRPAATVGTGTVFVGAGVRTFTPSESTPWIGSVAGFPPGPRWLGSETLSDVSGYTVATPCNPGPEAPYTELLVGLELSSADGGGWDGILVEYEVDGSARTLKIDRGMFICGASQPCQ